MTWKRICKFTRSQCKSSSPTRPRCCSVPSPVYNRKYTRSKRRTNSPNTRSRNGTLQRLGSIARVCATVRLFNSLVTKGQETLATTMNPTNDKINEAPSGISQANMPQNLELYPLTKIHDESEDTTSIHGVRKNRPRFIARKEGDQAVVNELNSIQIKTFEDEKEGGEQGTLRLMDEAEEDKSKDAKEIMAGNRNLMEFHEELKTEREHKPNEFDIAPSLSYIAKAEDSYTAMLSDNFI
eukprot:TRINITY_DN17303_c0_g1_i1.p1 TRINITY_DN17303_c0_g1~~TRINITY_DN17303_c0_g1_i1.p1  ORF type:complete len:239 (-),score=29.07 TRINITY_DN17303_c0_g1_i1:128-844(-)